MQKIKGANMDIDFSNIPGMNWEQGKCPKGDNHKCAVKNRSLCEYFGGIEAPDILICKFKNEGEN